MTSIAIIKRKRRHLAMAASTIALTAAMPAAHGAEATANDANTTQIKAEEVVVTGTRIVRDGYEAPTPVSVLSAEELNAAGRNNVAETISQLPSFSNSALPSGRAASLNANGYSGISGLNLRGLGSNRVLVLLDGARVVAGNIVGTVDSGIMPDNLIQRVDVVTGGASAVYGSDALSGVVNYVLDKEFTGFKGGVEGGVSSYGDGFNSKVNLAVGLPFAGNRGHLLISGQRAHDDGIPADGRSWRTDHNAAIITNPNYAATNGQPRLMVGRDFGLAVAAPGGLVSSGPLKGVMFGPGGTPSMLRYGNVVSGNYMLGGDWASTRIEQYNDISFAMSRNNAFTRVSFDVTDNVNVYALYNFSEIVADSKDVRSWNFGDLTVTNANPFIPAAIATQMAAANVTSLQLGTTNEDIGPMIQHNESTLRRWVVGAEGHFNLGESAWTWNGYYQSSSTVLQSNNYTTNLPRLKQAVDAVRSPTTGAIVCRSTLTNPSDGCVAYNPMGIGVNSQAAIDYVTGWSHGVPKLTQDVASLSANGEPFSDWAGPVSLALGVEHRREAVSGHSDPEDLLGHWFVGNYRSSFGSFDVTEGFVETVVPLAKDALLARELDFNAAARYTNYSTSGNVTTWKVGATWAPTGDLRFRATRSRDIRAPNVGDLFNAGISSPGTVTDPRTGLPAQINTTRSGNPDLKPEEADTTGLGFVYSPSWFEGFTTSVDYYNIDVNGAITTLGGQQYVDGCFAGNAYLCTFVTTDANGAPSFIALRPANAQRLQAQGVDVEATYRLPLAALSDSLRGDLTLRFMGTRTVHLKTTDPFGRVVEGAGVNAEGMGAQPSAGDWAPKFKANLSATYNLDAFTASLTLRYLADGVYNPQFIECTSGCPTATAEHPTIDNNHVDGAEWFDLAVNYQVADGLEAFLSVINLLDKDPPLVAGETNSGYFTGTGALALYDIKGRMFQGGLRFKF